MSDLLELELEAVMTYPVWVLGIKFELSRRASIFTHSAISPVQDMISKAECQKPE